MRWFIEKNEARVATKAQGGTERLELKTATLGTCGL